MSLKIFDTWHLFPHKKVYSLTESRLVKAMSKTVHIRLSDLVLKTNMPTCHSLKTKAKFILCCKTTLSAKKKELEANLEVPPCKTEALKN